VSTQVTLFHPQLPIFLQKQELFDDTDKATAGIGGGLPAHVSIKGSKLRLIDASGEEALVNQMHLDVIVLSANEHLSKVFYAGAFDPNDSGPPDCWSDNGIGPSAQSSSPQHGTCASCPQNAFGSRVNQATGSNMKACADRKKLAVVLGADTPVMINGAASVLKAYAQVYLLSLPTMSMRPWAAYAKDVKGKGVPVIGVVTRLTFDADVSYPALLFAAVGFVPSEAVFQQLMKLRGETATTELLGMNDRPLASAGQVPASAASAALQPTVTATAQAAPSAAPATDTSGTRRPRGRPPASSVPVQTSAIVPPPAAAAPLFPQGNGAAIQAAQATDKSLDALLASVMGPARKELNA
jgi:hypothetical protein